MSGMANPRGMFCRNEYQGDGILALTAMRWIANLRIASTLRGGICMRRVILGIALAFLLAIGVFPSSAGAKSLGGCPQGWQLVTVESLGISEEQANGIPSLDGNKDGMTCITPVPSSPNAINSGAIVFRDNTVGA